MEIYKNVKTFHAISRQAWRAWLETNCLKETSVFLIIYKKESGVSSVTYDQAVDEALCFGWIDSKINKRNEASFYQYFSIRNPKSNWSRVNKEKIARLIASGMMSDKGMEMVEYAKKSGTWNALDDVENLVIPDDLQKEFEGNDIAFSNWIVFPRTVRRAILEWIFNAKKKETRMERIQKTVMMAAINKRINFDK